MRVIQKAMPVIALPLVLSCSPANLILPFLIQPFPAQPSISPQTLSISHGGEIGGAFHSYLSVIKDAALSKYRVLLPVRIVGAGLQYNGTMGSNGSWTILVRSPDDNSYWSGEVTSSGTKIQTASPPPGYGSISPSPAYDNYFIVSSKWQYDSTAIPDIDKIEAMTLMPPREFEQLHKVAFIDPVWSVLSNGLLRYFNAKTGAEIPSLAPKN